MSLFLCQNKLSDLGGRRAGLDRSSSPPPTSPAPTGGTNHTQCSRLHVGLWEDLAPFPEPSFPQGRGCGSTSPKSFLLLSPEDQQHRAILPCSPSGLVPVVGPRALGLLHGIHGDYPVALPLESQMCSLTAELTWAALPQSTVLH